MADEMQAIDIPDDGANPAAAAGGVAAAAQPDRHGFWAWRERVMSRNNDNNPRERPTPYLANFIQYV
jgi:hypothetical protein